MKWINADEFKPKILGDGWNRSNPVIVLTDDEEIELAALHESGWKSFSCLRLTGNNLKGKRITHWLPIPCNPGDDE